MSTNSQKNIIRIATATFVVIMLSAVCIYMIFHFGKVINAFSSLLKIIAPIIYGFIIAYILIPVCAFFENNIFKAKTRKPKTAKRLRIVSIAITLILFFLAIAGFFRLVIPELYKSFTIIIKSFPTYERNVETWLTETKDKLPENIKMNFDYSASEIMDEIYNFLTENILPSFTVWMDNIKSGVFGVVKFVLNLVIGIIVSVYLMANRELMIGQCKKTIYGLFKKETANNTINNIRYINKTFQNFFVGKLADSLCIGLITFIVMTVFQFDYAALISVIIGITNIIPVFGPFIGAIPSALLIFMVDPVECFYFVIFVIILQQFDGNILGPKILGSSTGLSGFWVIFAITLFGGCFGIVGMLVGVPIFAVFFTGFKAFINSRLLNKNLTTDTMNYRSVSMIDDDNNFIMIPKEEVKDLKGKSTKKSKSLNPFNNLFNKDSGNENSETGDNNDENKN